MKNQLAFFGGKKLIPKSFQRYNSIGREELAAVKAVIETGVLSRFLGCWDPDFYGGEKIQEFEREWARYFSVNHAVTVNSNTSGLITALGRHWH